jgi:hypothetical protein
MRGNDGAKKQQACILHACRYYSSLLVKWRTFKIGPGQAQWHPSTDQPSQSNYAMTTLISASYALQRQKLAVERTLYARSAEESQLAARWASAWHKLVQRKLDQDLASRLPARADFGGFLINPPSRVLH